MSSLDTQDKTILGPFLSLSELSKIHEEEEEEKKS